MENPAETPQEEIKETEKVEATKSVEAGQVLEAATFKAETLVDTTMSVEEAEAVQDAFAETVRQAFATTSGTLPPAVEGRTPGEGTDTAISSPAGGDGPFGDVFTSTTDQALAAIDAQADTIQGATEALDVAEEALELAEQVLSELQGEASEAQESTQAARDTEGDAKPADQVSESPISASNAQTGEGEDSGEPEPNPLLELGDLAADSPRKSKREQLETKAAAEGTHVKEPVDRDSTQKQGGGEGVEQTVDVPFEPLEDLSILAARGPTQETRDAPAPPAEATKDSESPNAIPLDGIEPGREEANLPDVDLMAGRGAVASQAAISGQSELPDSSSTKIPESIIQGDVGDAYLLSQLASVAINNPERIVGRPEGGSTDRSAFTVELGEGRVTIGTTTRSTEAADWFSGLGGDSALNEFLKLQAEDPNLDPDVMNELYKTVSELREAALDEAEGAYDGGEAGVGDLIARLENLEDTLQVLNQDIAALEAFIEGNDSNGFTGISFHIPARESDGTYVLIPMQLPMNNDIAAEFLAILNVVVIQIIAEINQVEAALATIESSGDGSGGVSGMEATLG